MLVSFGSFGSYFLSLFVPPIGAILDHTVSLELRLGSLGVVLESTWSSLGLCYVSWTQFRPYDVNLKPLAPSKPESSPDSGLFELSRGVASEG